MYTHKPTFIFLSKPEDIYVYIFNRVKINLLNISKIGKIIGMCVYMYVCIHVRMYVGSI